MLTKQQIEFIKASLCAQGAAVPAQNNGEIARLFISTLDELEAQLKAFETAPKLSDVPHESA